jgi:hypothetical protein
MNAIETEEEYGWALNRFDELRLDGLLMTESKIAELKELSERIEEYELKHYPIEEASDESNKYRKRPIIVEAMQWDGTLERLNEIVKWSGYAVIKSTQDISVLLVLTLEGTMSAIIDDWIIKGVNGEFYPCKPDIFNKTYEPVREVE